MLSLLGLLSVFFITVCSQYATYYPQYGYTQPTYYSRSSYGYSQYPSYGYSQYPGYYQQYGYSNYRAPSLLGGLFGGGYNRDQYGNSYIGTPQAGFFLTCNGRGCAVRGK